MSSLHHRHFEQVKAQRAFERHAKELWDDLGKRVPVRFLELRVEMLEQLVEKTGGSLLTEAYRDTLCDLKKQVALRAESQRIALRRTGLHVVSMS